MKMAGAASLGFTGLCRFFDFLGSELVFANDLDHGYGPILADPKKLFDLPQKFSYQVISQVGEEMDDGFLVPGRHDGMGTFSGPKGKTILIRNHEINVRSSSKLGPYGAKNEFVRKLKVGQMYDQGRESELPALGGTTTLVYDTQAGRLESHHLSLAGTVRNCAGGVTPWNSWITCEESVQRADLSFAVDHGYNFEVPASHTVQLADPFPLKEMGRFNHEAVAVDPNSSIVYQTEDREDGLIYRFISNLPGQLSKGGQLQALQVSDQKSLDTRNWNNPLVSVGTKMAVEWVNIDNVESPNDDLRYQGYEKGAARFARGEGMWYGLDKVFFVCTNGGKEKQGQIWQYIPSIFEGTSREKNAPGNLELFLEPNDSTLLERADNLTVSPWGDLIVCEDGSGTDYLVGVTPTGIAYKLGRNSFNNSELSGVTFSPDGSTLFVNIQVPGLTLAITGPW